jgi:hypothetical protein
MPVEARFVEASWIPLAMTTHYIRCASLNSNETGNDSHFYRIDEQQNEPHVLLQFNKLCLTGEQRRCAEPRGFECRRGVPEAPSRAVFAC